nr:hypothetical protein [Tanacetum cinerariifolium]
MATNDKESSASGTDNRPPMLEESDFESWKIRIERYIRGKPLGKLIWKSIKNGPTPHPTSTVTTGEGEQQTQVTREKTDEEFTEAENIKEQQQKKETLFDQYERFRANGNESIHDYFVRFHKLINDMKITNMEIPVHQRNTKFVNNLPSYWGKYVTIIKNSKDISTVSYVDVYTHLKSYEQHAMKTDSIICHISKTLSKMNQTSGNADPLAYMAQATQSTSLPSQYVPQPPQYAPAPQQAPQSTNDATLATMNQIMNLLKNVQRRAPGNKGKQVAIGSQGNKKGNQVNAQGKLVTCYKCHGQGHVAKECKEKKRAKDSQWFKDKALLMESKEKGVVLDVDAEAFLADMEYTAPYAEPLAITTTTTFEVSHEDAYDFNVDKGPHTAAVFMANVKQTGPSIREGSNNDSTFFEVQTYDNHFFENLNHQVSQEMHRGEQLDSDVDSVIDDHDNTISYHQYQLNNEVESVPTDVSSVLPGGIYVIAILDDLRSQLAGHIKANEEQSFGNDSLKAEFERYKTQVQNLEQSKVKKDLEQLVSKRNKRNADLEEQLVSLKQQLLQHVESHESLKTECEKLKNDKNALEESYLEELVCLRNTNKFVTELLQSNLLYLKTAQLCRPTLYLGDVIVDPVHTPFRVYDSEETLVQAEVSRAKMLERMKDPLCKVSSKPSLEIENKNLLIQNECLLAESVSKDICFVVLTSDTAVPTSVKPRSNCVKEHSRNLKLEAEILKYKAFFENPQVCNDSNSPEFNVFFEINMLKDQLQGKDDLIEKLKAQISNMNEVSAGPNLSTLEYQALETENTQLKEELTAVRIKNDSLRDENMSIKKRYQDLYKSKAESNSNVSNGTAVPEKPKVLAPGLYAITPKYVPSHKRNNREVNTPLPRKDKVSPVKKPNVHVYMSTRINLSLKLCTVKNLNSVNAKNPKVKNNANVKQVWKATGKIFASVGSKWRPAGRKFTLGDTCPLTRITKPDVVSLEKSRSVSTSEPAINVSVTPRFSAKTLTSYKHKDRKTKDNPLAVPLMQKHRQSRIL